MADGFARLSPRSRQLRFLTPKEDLSPAELRYFIDVGHHDHEALGALDHADRRGVGIARYIRDADDPDAAEIAVTIIDDWQGRGLGSPPAKPDPGRRICRMGVSVRTNGPAFPEDSSILVAGGTRPRGHRMPDYGRLRNSWDTGPPRLVLAGDIDLNSHAALIASLARARAAGGTGQVHVDMAGVTFCDVAGLRIILHGSGRRPAAAIRPCITSRRACAGCLICWPEAQPRIW